MGIWLAPTTGCTVENCCFSCAMQMPFRKTNRKRSALEFRKYLETPNSNLEIPPTQLLCVFLNSNIDSIRLNYELFIARRFRSAKKDKSSISAPIIKIAITAIALGIIIMLIAVATGAGLQYKIRDKMAGFKGHIQIVNYDANNSDVSTTAIKKEQDFYPTFKHVKGIKNVQIFANKAGILRTKTDFEGIIFKGVSSDYDWTFFEEYLVEGKIPDFKPVPIWVVLFIHIEIFIRQGISRSLYLNIAASAKFYVFAFR